jgi:hypothetical protein
MALGSVYDGRGRGMGRMLCEVVTSEFRGKRPVLTHDRILWWKTRLFSIGKEGDGGSGNEMFGNVSDG